jgi:hypothetical protein
MQITTKLELVYKKLEDDSASILSAMSNGACKSFDEYKYLCGQIRSIRLAQDYIKEIAKQEMDDD